MGLTRLEFVRFDEKIFRAKIYLTCKKIHQFFCSHGFVFDCFSKNKIWSISAIQDALFAILKSIFEKLWLFGDRPKKWNLHLADFTF